MRDETNKCAPTFCMMLSITCIRLPGKGLREVKHGDLCPGKATWQFRFRVTMALVCFTNSTHIVLDHATEPSKQ